jgi:hypothetical protein
LLARQEATVAERTNDVNPVPDVEIPGDEQAPDIVGPTGEEMPRQDHDDVTKDGRGTEKPADTDRLHRPA